MKRGSRCPLATDDRMKRGSHGPLVTDDRMKRGSRSPLVTDDRMKRGSRSPLATDDRRVAGREAGRGVERRERVEKLCRPELALCKPQADRRLRPPVGYD
jgi:hypothetical protein